MAMRLSRSTAALYQPLCSSDAIRVLHIQPGQPPDDIICSLERTILHDLACSPRVTRSRAQSISYDALSYCWGDPAAPRINITCNGRRLPITSTLHQALRRIRGDVAVVVLWVDQICINQRDPAERSQQVQLMGDIYRRAHKTIIWLGEASEGSTTAIAFARHIKDVLGSYLGQKPLSNSEEDKLGLDYASNKYGWDALSNILARPWFQRSWVIQEVILSVEPIAMCGGDVLDWQELLQIYHLMDEAYLSGYLEFGCEGASQGFYNLGQIASTKENSQNESFVSLLYHCRNFQCTDPRDKIFAFLGIPTNRADPTQQEIFPDYTKTAQEVYKDIALMALRNEGFHSENIVHAILCNAGIAWQQHDLPSWVPDWSVNVENVAWLDGPSFTASEWLREPPRVRERFGRLQVFGRLVGVVKGMSDELDLDQKPDIFDQVVVLNGWMRGLDCLVENCFAYSEEQMQEALWRSLVVDTLRNVGRVPRDYEQHFHEFEQVVNNLSPEVSNWDTQFDPWEVGYRRYYQAMTSTFTGGRKFCVLDTGYMGVILSATQEGDQVFVISDVDYPMVLRPHGKEYCLVGACYIHGIMDGEAVVDVKDEDLEEIILV